MPRRLSTYRRATTDGAASRHLWRDSALLVSWLVLVSIGSTSSAAALTATGPEFGTSRTVHDTRGTAAVGAIFDGPVSSSGDHFCTASVIDSPGGDLLVTAAHCLGGGTDDLYFVPGYHDGIAPYGVWRIGRATVDPRWSDTQDPDYDVAFAAVQPLHGRRVQDVVGGYTLDTSGPENATVRLTGYPSSADAPLTCVNRASAFSGTQSRIACSAYSGGTSGSPWVVGGNRVIGVIGGFEQGGATPDVSYSAAFGDAVAALYRQATTPA